MPRWRVEEASPGAEQCGGRVADGNFVQEEPLISDECHSTAGANLTFVFTSNAVKGPLSRHGLLRLINADKEMLRCRFHRMKMNAHRAGKEARRAGYCCNCYRKTGHVGDVHLGGQQFQAFDQILQYI